MASCTFAHRRFLGALFQRPGMMPEIEKSPVVGLGKALTVFHCDVHAVVLTVEISASGRFLTRAVWKSRIKDSRQLLYDDRSFWKLAGLQIRLDVSLFYVHVMIFGEVRLAAVETIGRQGSTHKNPRAIAGWPLQLAIGLKHCSGGFNLSGNGSRANVK